MSFRTPRPTTRQRLVGTANAAPAPDIIWLKVTFTMALFPSNSRCFIEKAQSPSSFFANEI